MVSSAALPQQPSCEDHSAECLSDEALPTSPLQLFLEAFLDGDVFVLRGSCSNDGSEAAWAKQAAAPVVDRGSCLLNATHDDGNDFYVEDC